MVYKAGKLKGELTTAEIRKLIRAHNVLVSIKIPKGASRDDIIAVLKKNKYKVDHEGGALVPLVEMKRRNKITMTKADEVLPKPKTKEERLEAKATRDKAKATKAKEVLEKESKIKATGVQQGAAIQRLISKKKATEAKKVVKKEKKVEPKFKIDKSKQPKQTPSKVDIKIKPDSNTKKIVKEPTESKVARNYWDSVKDLDWKPNVRTKILALFNEASMPKGKKYYIVTGALIKNGKLIIKYIFTRQRAGEVFDTDEEEEREEATRIPRTAKFTIPKSI